MTEETNLTDEECITTFPGALLLSFKFVRIYHICLAIISMISIIYFILFHRKQLKFHFNIKILFYFQFFTCFVHATVSGIFQTHHLILSILAKGPCDVALSPTLYVSLHLPFTFSLFCTAFSQIVMVGERTLASLFYKCYEKTTKVVGALLIILSIVFPLFICFFIYSDIAFDFPVMSVIATPPKATKNINYAFFALIASYIITVFHSIGLYRHNEKQNQTAVRSETDLELSSKYQISENVSSSRILWQLTCAQLTIYLVYGIATFTIRLLSPTPKPPFLAVLTDLAYTPPIYCVVMPLLCIYTTQKAQNERNVKITSLVGMSSTGREGWNNYQKMLKNQWA